MDFKTSKTRTCLINAFAGESQARNRYTFFSSVAKKEGYEQISEIFTDTANNEKEHAKLFYKHLVKLGGPDVIQVTESYPVILADTLAHVKSSIAGENEEWTTAYPEAAKIADEEGFPEVAKTFGEIAEAEKAHDKRFEAIKNSLESGSVFKKDHTVKWRCRNCGRVHEGPEAPDSCPTCAHPQSFFELLAENY